MLLALEQLSSADARPIVCTYDVCCQFNANITQGILVADGEGIEHAWAAANGGFPSASGAVVDAVDAV